MDAERRVCIAWVETNVYKFGRVISGVLLSREGDKFLKFEKTELLYGLSNLASIPLFSDMVYYECKI